MIFVNTYFNREKKFSLLNGHNAEKIGEMQ